MLHEFIVMNRDEIIERCRAKVTARSEPAATEAEINHGVPLFLEQLVHVLQLVKRGKSNPDIVRSAGLHGHELLLQGFTVSQVVHDYGDVCQAITDLAVETQAPISADDFRTLNQCLDEAIAGAVTEYGREKKQFTLVEETARGTERLGFLAHELRNLLNTAIVAFEVLKTGNVGVAGSTGAVLHRSLMGLRSLVGRSLDEVRLAGGVQNRAQFSICEFIEELAVAATLEANRLGITLTLTACEEGVLVHADRQILAAVVGNLLQNAFKFTRPHSAVTLRAIAGAERVLIEIEDECGGLPGGNADGLFQPFRQHGADKSGLGLGLVFSRWGAEANNGQIHVRNLPEHGCVFTVDLPRLQVPADALI